MAPTFGPAGTGARLRQPQGRGARPEFEAQGRMCWRRWCCRPGGSGWRSPGIAWRPAPEAVSLATLGRSVPHWEQVLQRLRHPPLTR